MFITYPPKTDFLCSGGVGFLMVGFAITFAMMATNYWALWADVFAGFGAGAATFAINRGEINLS